MVGTANDDHIGPAEWYAGIGSVLGGIAMAEDGPNDSGASGVRPGDRIGKYTIIDRLGEGSFRNAAARAGLQAAILGHDSACHRRVRSKASDLNLGFRGGALHSCSPPDSSAVEPGEGQMGNGGEMDLHANNPHRNPVLAVR